MRATPSSLRRTTRTHSTADTGQAALVLVIAFTVMLTIFGGVMISSIVNNAPILKQASIQRYAYRALASGLNAYQSAINANPYLAACNYNTNYPGGVNANPQCGGLSYQVWSLVPGTDAGNGVIPEYYKFDNPQQVKDSTTQAITYLEVQIVGAAGFPGKNVFYSTVAKFTPANGFLNNVWWSNFESFNLNPPAGSGSSYGCNYFYTSGWNRYVNNVNGSPNQFLVGGNSTTPASPCIAVNFAPGDQIYGPVYTNDSIYVDTSGGGPTFTGTVNTADPHCLFVDYSSSSTSDLPGCTGIISTSHYTATGSSSGNTRATGNVTNAQLAATAQQGGCYYMGPTTVTLSVVSGVGMMTINSPDTPGYPGYDTDYTPIIGDKNCPTSTGQGAKGLPTNGVVYVDQATSGASLVNPLDSATSGLSQVASNCPNCYYGQSSTPGTEGDAFVRGSLSGHLTVASWDNVIIDGSISYYDCSWGTGGTGTPSQSICQYNNSSTGTNDTLGLIANKNVEINRPVYNPTSSLRGMPLPDCGGTWVAPLCDPATTTGSPTGGQGLTIDATVLALKESFAVNNYSAPGNEGQLTIYGSIQQNARGPVGQGSNGYVKYYLWDPRLTLYGPPYYMTPGTASWALNSSAESYVGTEPQCPPVQATPTTVQPSFPVSGSTLAGTGACLSAS